MRAMILATLLTAALVASNGCCACGPCGPCGQGCFDCPPCGATCGATCGAACSPCDDCSPCGDCGSCGYAPCGPCGGGPIRFMLGVLGFHCGGCCDGGCGEVYRGDWCSDPPACSDPCDCYGNYSGCSSCGGGEGFVPGNAMPAYQAPSGGCNCGSHAAATRVNPNRAIASTSRKTVRKAPYAQNQKQYASQPQIISESDEVVEEGGEESVTPASYQAKNSRQIDYRR